MLDPCPDQVPEAPYNKYHRSVLMEKGATSWSGHHCLYLTFEQRNRLAREKEEEVENILGLSFGARQ